MSRRIPLPLAKLLDEISATSTYPLSEHRPLLGEECYELIGHIRRLEIGITSPGLHRPMLERLVAENAELRLAQALAEKAKDEALQLTAQAVKAGEEIGSVVGQLRGRNAELEGDLLDERHFKSRLLQRLRIERQRTRAALGMHAEAVARAEKAEARAKEMQP